MLSTPTPSSSPHQVQWKQPIGVWRERGAGPLLLRTGLGLPFSDRKETEALLDTAGFTVWHYWAHSPSPVHSFNRLRETLGEELLNRIASSGEHPWHFLLLDGNTLALETWKKIKGIPLEPPALHRTGDTFSHCLAWSGENSLWKVFEKSGLASINAKDAQQLSPLMIAVHRGDMSFVQSFLMAGADPMAADSQGRTALHHAAQYGDQALFSLLEDMGGDPEQVDDNGIEPLSLLRARRQISASDAQALREYWARRRLNRLPF